MLEMWRVVKSAVREPIIKDDLLAVVKGVASTAAPGWKLRNLSQYHLLDWLDKPLNESIVVQTNSFSNLFEGNLVVKAPWDFLSSPCSPFLFGHI